MIKPFFSKLSNAPATLDADISNVLIDTTVAIIHIMNHIQPQPDLRGVLSRRISLIVANIIEIIGINKAMSVEIINVIIVAFEFPIGKISPNIIALVPAVIIPIRAIVNAPIMMTPMNAKNMPTMIAAMRNSHFTISPRREPMRLADSRSCSLFK